MCSGRPGIACGYVCAYICIYVFFCLYICLSKRFLLKFFQLYDWNVLLWNALCWRSAILETWLCQILSNSKCLPHFQFWHVANYSNGFNILLSTPVHVQLWKDVSSNSDVKFNMYVCITAFSMEMSNGLPSFLLSPPSLPLFPHPSSLNPPFFAFSLYLPLSISLQCPWCLLLRASPDLLWVLRGSLWVAAAPLLPFHLTSSPSPHGLLAFLWGQYHYGN